MFARSLRSAAPAVRALHTSALLRAAEKSAAEVALRDALKAAMKAKDKPAVHTIKTILSDVTNLAKTGPNPDEPATQEGVINTIRKGIEKRVSTRSSENVGRCFQTERECTWRTTTATSAVRTLGL